MKRWYQSKTILVQVVGGIGLIAGAFVPAVGDFVQSYFSELGAGWVFVNTVLRLITKDKVQIG
jgi:hypothetical protein